MNIRHLFVLLAAALATACANKTQEPQYNGKIYPAEKTDNTLRILAIGNSFTENMTVHLPQLIADAGADSVVFAYAAFAGASLEYQYNHLVSQDATFLWDLSLGGQPFVQDTVRQSLPFCVDYADWDVIVIQQRSSLAGQWDSISPYLATVVRLLKTAHPRAKIAWQMTWALASHFDKPEEFALYNGSRELMEQAIEETTEKIVATGLIDMVIPSGRAIAAARRTDIDPTGKELSPDGRHLDEGAGCYIAACCAYETLLAEWVGEDLMDLPADSSDHGVVKVTTENCPTLRKFAKDAKW